MEFNKLPRRSGEAAQPGMTTFSLKSAADQRSIVRGT
jgi:hypothetical protein